MNLCQALKALKQIRDDFRHVRRFLEQDEIRSALEMFTRGRISFYIGGQQTRRIVVKDNQQVVVSIEFDDAMGFPVGGTPDALPVYEGDDNGNIVSLEPSADGLSCLVKATGKALGTVNLKCSAMVGGKSFEGTAVIPVIAGDAVSMKLNVGEAQDIPAAPAP